jgi:hypothetical protein
VIVHVAVFRWHDTVTAQQVSDLEDGLGKLPALIPELVSYRFGKDLGIRGTADFAVVALLAEAGDVAKYLDHPAHQKVSRSLTNLMAAERSTIQFPDIERQLTSRIG